MIGILNAYHFDPDDAGYQLDYSRLFFEFVQQVFPDKKNSITEFKVGQGQFPQSVHDCEIWFITGSPKSVYEDLPWIHRLTAFVQELHRRKIKTVGICFGHQLIAHALGGKVARSPLGWGVGVRSFAMRTKKNWMRTQQLSDPNKVALLFSHQDQVEILPPEAELLAEDEFCKYQMLQIGEHIMTMQGHPEFSVKFARERLISRWDKMSSETFERAMASYTDHSDFSVMMEWIRKFTEL